MNRTILLIAVFLVSIVGYPQSYHLPKSYVDSTGRYFQQANQPLYLFASSSPHETPQVLKTVAEGPIYFEGHGIHKLKHMNHHTGKQDMLLVYADGNAPVTQLKATNTPIYRSTGGIYYGANLTLTLEAVDHMSGVDKVFHAHDGGEFTNYKSISFPNEGTYDYQYYAIDKVGNVEKVKSARFSVDLTPPSTFHNIMGISEKKVISLESSIYLESEDSLSGVAQTFFKYDRSTEYLRYSGNSVPFKQLEDGLHTLYYYSIDNTGNQEVTDSVTFYLDKTAPILSADILGDKFIVEDKVYFSGRTKLKLTAVDNKSGIKDLMYAINGSKYNPYYQPFYLPNTSGQHRVEYYAVDQVQNMNRANFRHKVGLIYLDLTGPSIDLEFDGPVFYKGDTLFAGKHTEFKLAAKDQESGLKSVHYLIDDTDEMDYKYPFTIPTPGNHMLHCYSIDNVNNRNSKDIPFLIDSDGPKINYQFSASSMADNVYPSYSTIFLAVEDQVAIESITYSINGMKKQPYFSPIQGLKKNNQYVIVIEATDKLGNMSTETIQFATGKY